MSYRTDIRLLLSRDGYGRLKEIIQSDNIYLDGIDEIVGIPAENESSLDMFYLKWDDKSWKKDSSDNDVEIFVAALKELQKEGYSFRYSEIGEGIDDIQEWYHDGSIDGHGIDYIPIDRKFNDTYVERNILEDINQELINVDVLSAYYEKLKEAFKDTDIKNINDFHNYIMAQVNSNLEYDYGISLDQNYDKSLQEKVNDALKQVKNSNTKDKRSDKKEVTK